MGLDGVELVLAWEEEFGIEISDADAAKMETPAHVIDFVCTRVGEAKNLSREQVADKVKEIIFDQLGISDRQYAEDKRFVEDFGVG